MRAGELLRELGDLEAGEPPFEPGDLALDLPAFGARREALLRAIFDLLKAGGRFDPQACLQSSWQQIETDAIKRFAPGA